MIWSDASGLLTGFVFVHFGRKRAQAASGFARTQVGRRGDQDREQARVTAMRLTIRRMIRIVRVARLCHRVRSAGVIVSVLHGGTSWSMAWRTPPTRTAP